MEDMLILPPQEVKETITKTAWFIASKGVVYENKLRENERDNHKFCFLNPNDPYHAFYVHTKKQMLEGRFVPETAESEPQVEVPFSHALARHIDARSFQDMEEDSLSALYRASIDFDDEGATELGRKLFHSYRRIIARTDAAESSFLDQLKAITESCMRTKQPGNVVGTFNWEDLAVVEHVDVVPERPSWPVLHPLELCAMSRDERLALYSKDQT